MITNGNSAEIDAVELEAARKKVSERYSLPRLNPVMYGAFGALAAWLIVVLFSGLAGLDLERHGLAVLIVCGVAFGVPFLLARAMVNRHAFYLFVAEDQLRIEAENRVIRRRRIDERLLKNSDQVAKHNE